MSYAIRSALAALLHWLAYRVDPEPALPANDDFYKAGGTD
jgi:hypothetical protein